ncbi:MAG: class I SAM-dependent methyltransferase [Elusimicrobia bacterium]|nr:class I SAM-dependent methyltransferase [Elusimicrobiota bacterium]
MPEAQRKQDEWEFQWTHLEDRESWLYADWIWPNRLEDFADKTVLDAGCGPGHHVRLVAAKAKRVVGIDLNTVSIARQKTADLRNVAFLEGDIAEWDTGERFDVVYSVGVVHHTDDPDRTVAHLKNLLKPGGRLILWVYAREGNALNEFFLEPAKSLLLRRMSRPVVLWLSHALTLALYPMVYSLYLLPLRALPFYHYFANFRRMPYTRNQANVFDKLNAPTTHFISRTRAEKWLEGLQDPHISPYVGVSWRISGTK